MFIITDLLAVLNISGFQINDYTSNEKISKFIFKVRKGQIFPGLWRGDSFTAVSSYILLVCAIAY